MDDQQKSESLQSGHGPLPPQSTVKLVSDKGKRYQMTFYAKDPEFSFLHVRRRSTPNNSVHKSSQACSTGYFVEVRDVRSEKYMTVMKRYRIQSCSRGASNQQERSSKLKEKSQNISKIYVEKDGILFMLTVDSFEVDVMQSVPDDQSMNTETLASSSDGRRGGHVAELDRAVLVARLDNDVMKVRFALADCDLKPVTEYVSRGSQCSERYAYVKCYPYSLEKPAFCAVPLTTYIYTDPMIAIRRRNYIMRKAGYEPKWMAEQRKYRRELSSKSENPMNENAETLRSVISFEFNGHRVKLRCGYLTASIEEGAGLYEEFVSNNRNDQRVALRSPNETITDSVNAPN